MSIPMYDDFHYVSRESDIPTDKHFAVIVFDSIWIEGDERSRTNPGHGYPGYSQQIIKYIAFAHENALKKWIIENESKRNFAVIHARRVSFEKSISIKVGI